MVDRWIGTYLIEKESVCPFSFYTCEMSKKIHHLSGPLALVVSLGLLPTTRAGTAD
jgi:hypothetical protein